jgi:hypothetical protein
MKPSNGAPAPAPAPAPAASRAAWRRAVAASRRLSDPTSDAMELKSDMGHPAEEVGCLDYAGKRAGGIWEWRS